MGKSIIEGFAIGLAFVPMIFPIIMIAFVIFKMMDIIGPLLELVPKAIEAALTIFNPKKFVNDLIFGISYGLSSVISGIMSSLDSGSTPNKPENEAEIIPKTCVSPSLFNLFFLIICPPLALFLDRGVQGMFLVIVCSILTVKLYYFPGLIFAALHILC